MSALAFVSPTATEEAAVARVPSERRARAAGATFERRARWDVAVGFPAGAAAERWLTETVAFADRSQIGKLELHGAPGDLAALLSRAAGGQSPRPGSASRTAEASLCCVNPSRALVIFDAACDASQSRVATTSRAHGVTAIDLTCGLAAIAVAGPARGELLARLCAIDLRESVVPVGGFRPGSIARTPGYVLRDGPGSLLLLVGWALGDYLWHVVADAAERLGGGPVGVDALTSEIAQQHA